MSKSKDAPEKADPIFDGHLEKNIKDMTPTERIDYLWQMVELRFISSNRVKPKTDDKHG